MPLPMRLGPIDYAAADPRRPRPYAYGTAFTLAFYFAFVTVILAAVVPRLETVFRDFGTELPLATVALLNFSRLFRQFYLWTGFIPIVVLTALAGPTSRGARGVLRLALMFLIAATVLFLAAAVFLPMVQLTESMSR